ncbi:MAG: ExbD/TolR family protein [Bacteriovoracia bacterium]
MKFKKFGQSGSKLDFEINIVPIVDCLTILVTFILASGLYISIGILNVNVSSAVGATSSESEDPVKISVQMSMNHDLSIKLTGSGAQNEIRVGSVNNQWNFDRLKSELKKVQSAWPKVKTATLVSARDVAYQDVVKTMEATRNTHPDVVLGGF